MRSANLSRIGAVIALVALLVLPLASCGTGQITGPGLFRMDGAGLHKILVGLAGLSAVLAIFFVSRRAQLTLGSAGILSMLIAAWMVIGDGSDDTQVRAGTWIVVLGFGLVLAAGLMQPAVPARARSRPRVKKR